MPQRRYVSIAPTGQREAIFLRSETVNVPSSRAIAPTDAGCVLECTSSSPTQLTINAGGMAAGDSIVVQRAGAGAVTFAFGSGMEREYDAERFNAAITTAYRYGGVTLFFKAPSLVWLTGALEPVPTTPAPASDATPAWLFSLIGDY